jgi:CMP-N,N'-diacetyllegionaminic acid synthase
VRIVALIPARAGSKRIPGKNTKLLGGKPLIQWTIEAAKASGVFAEIRVCTDDAAAYDIARACGVNTWTRGESDDTEPDIAWIREFFGAVAIVNPSLMCEAFAILRPTSPFRNADTIRRAVKQFKEAKCSSLRAVEKVRQHPGKMWQDVLYGGFMQPLISKRWELPEGPTLCEGRIPWHSLPTQSLPTVYVQNSSLEIAWTWCVTTVDTISGPKVAPFFTEGMEGFSIDYPEDWERAERYVASLQATAAAE